MSEMELKSRIDAAFLPVVNKPTRFLGNEFDAFVKNSDEIKLKIALCYADLYDAGMRNIAFESLYYLLNDAKTIWAERCYFPGIEAEATLQSAEIPLFSLESKTALNQFQIITFFLQDWLSCTNVLSMLNVAQLPLRQSERSDAAPLIIGCGPVMSNPEPLTAFFDAVIIGDPETAMLEIATIVEQQSGATKADVLKLLCGIAGVYVPSLYQPQFNSFREFQGLSATAADVPARISARTGKTGAYKSLSFKPLAAIADTAQNRHSFDVINVPVITDSLGAPFAFRHSGILQPSVQIHLFQELQNHLSRLENLSMTFPISFTVDGNSDYWGMLKDKWLVEEPRITLSLPEGRMNFRKPNSTDVALDLKQSPFVIAMHAATPRLRTVVNCALRDADIVAALKAALEKGWSAVQLNFTIGLPTEKPDDVAAIEDVVRMCMDAAQPFPDADIIVSVQIFSPTPHTPFQWEKPENPAAIEKKLEMLKIRLAALPVRFVYQHPKIAALQSIIARSDRQLADVIAAAYRNGARFEGNPESINPEAWDAAFAETQLPLDWYRSAISITVALPWDHIDVGISKTHLKEEKLRALQGQLHPLNKERVSLGYGGIKRSDFERYCQSGATQHRVNLPGQSAQSVVVPSDEPVRFGRRGKKKQVTTPAIKRKIRVRYSKTGAMRFISHLDNVRVFERCAKLAKIPLVYSQGLRRNPKIGYGMPLPTGISSIAEYLDMEVEVGRELDLAQQFNTVLPEGIRILQFQGIFRKVSALAAIINCSTYEIALQQFKLPQNWIDEWLAKPEAMIQRAGKDGMKDVDIRPFVQKIYLEKDVLHVTLVTIEGRATKINEVLESMLAPHDVDYRYFLIQRTGQLISDGETTQTPFDVL